VQLLCLVGSTEESSRRRRRGRRKSGGKKQELPPLPYLYRGAVIVGTVVMLHYPDRSCEHRHMVARRGAAVPITVPLSQLWQ
jgi:hypothetical protein